MSNGTTWRHSNKVIGIALAVLVVFEVFFLVGDFGDTVRYAMSGLIAVTLILGVIQLSSNRRRR